MDWERIKGLRDEVGKDAFDEVVALFLAETDEKVAGLRADADACDVEADMHFMKGAALNLGFDDLAGKCERAEKLANAGRPDEVDLPAILECYAASRAELVAFRTADAA